MLTVPHASVLKMVKIQRRQAFDEKTPGFEKGMKKCPNCDELGLFVHDGSLAKCVHPEHDDICAARLRLQAEEDEEAERNRTKPRKRTCTTCACYGMFKPGHFRLFDGAEKAPKRCDRHKCLSPEKMEISCGDRGQCDACMQIFCFKCHRCKCYKSSYTTRRCDRCVEAHDTWDPDAEIKCPPLYPLSQAFTATNEKLITCNICRAKRTLRTNKVYT